MIMESPLKISQGWANNDVPLQNNQHFCSEKIQHTISLLFSVSAQKKRTV